MAVSHEMIQYDVHYQGTGVWNNVCVEAFLFEILSNLGQLPWYHF